MRDPRGTRADRGVAPRPRRGAPYSTPDDFDNRVGLHDACSINPLGFHAWMFQRLDLRSSDRVLEVGSGTGRLWQSVTRGAAVDCESILSDLSLGMVRAARGRLECATTHRFIACDVLALPFPTRTFDVVIGNHMLYHVAMPEAAIAELSRVLRPGGRLFASTTGSAQFRELKALIRRFRHQRDGVMSSDAALFPHLTFTIESGVAALVSHFGRVVFQRYVDAVEITDADPLVLWARSLITQPVGADETPAFRQFVDEEIRRKGAIISRKDVGVFVASDPLEAVSASEEMIE
jgi:SAM-dependent methyltransferase